ncbi:MAG: HK97 family phage prohead protease [Gaiellaceae bacterium]
MTQLEQRRRSWVAEQGGLPEFIKRVAEHLQAKGMGQGHAIAVAVNACRRMCSDPDGSNWPGPQDVNPKSRAEACAAIARWEQMRAAARLKSGRRTLEMEYELEDRTVDVDVADLDTRGRTLVGYASVYNVLSHDLGGFKEQIAPGAFADVLSADVRCLLNHSPNDVLGRTRAGTLRLFDEERGLRFECDLPSSPLGENVREAVKRGDVDGASFRFKVAADAWDDNHTTRTVTKIAELHDVTVATYGAYPDASIELRTRPDPSEHEEEHEVETEARTGSGLTVEDRSAAPEHQIESRTLLGAFRRAGWEPGRRAEVAWQDFAGASESRALTWTGSVDSVGMFQDAAGPFGADRRYAWPAFPQTPVEPGVTSVQVLTQTARTLPAAATVVRAVDAVTNKPEAGSTLTLVPTAMKQLAAVQTGVPNVMLEQDRIESVIGTDLRLSINEGLDKLILDAIAGSGFQAPGTDPLLVSIRKAMTTIYANGYNPNLLILTPAASEALDVLQTVGSEKLYVFGAGRFAPGELFGMSVRVSKTIAAPAVVDSSALGRLYVSPISLASFEENAGRTNTTLVRMEGNGVFGVERQNAAVRIAAA